ncbi:MAG TPA: translation elongation factor 4 [Candidatus Paceibacterota bacterium]|nr:translation elongation factor 4 [Candidatus Paceibacterota bacterium]
MHIRNFVIIAHVDHGKSTLADRMLEQTGTIEARRMKPQYLDQLDLERERGITIKMAPVRMHYRTKDGEEYILNLIDTPGHSDFQYEVSRALEAVEGAVLLVDVTKGIQAQTLANYRNAKKAGLTIIGAVNKVDLPTAHPERVAKELAELIDVPASEIFHISGRTGQGVSELLEAVVRQVPAPKATPLANECDGRALVFDSLYNDHKGILAYARVVDGSIRAGDEVSLVAGGVKFKVKEVGHFLPEHKPAAQLALGEIGYIATGFKEPALVKIGDTVARLDPIRHAGGKPKALALPGYREATPVVFISFYPDGTTKFDDLKKGLERLRLTDAALSFEPDSNEALGRGLKVGFLGQLHFEITASRLEREFGCTFVTSFPSIAYHVKEHGGWQIVKDPHDFPLDAEAVTQPMIKMEILVPAPYMNQVVNLKNTFALEVREIHTLGDNVAIEARMPLAELIRDFDDQLKSNSAGYASFSYELDGEDPADVEKLEILVAEEVVPALTRIVFRRDVEREARQTVERLKELLPRQQFMQALQARVRGRIIARETIAAMKKNLGDFGKNGGDRTRKMKLWRKQARGKEKLQSMARVQVPVEVFREILKK